MRVVADSHSIYWYLAEPERLSAPALEAVSSAEDSDGIVVSAWTVPELWMAATRKHPARRVPRGAYELVRATLLDPDTTIDVMPVTAAMWSSFEAASSVLADPFDAAIVATARTLGLSLSFFHVALFGVLFEGEDGAGERPDVAWAAAEPVEDLPAF